MNFNDFFRSTQVKIKEDAPEEKKDGGQTNANQQASTPASAATVAK